MGSLPSLAIPSLFVFLWGTGFIVARLVTGTVEPLTFLSLRFALAAAVLGSAAVATGAAWPSGLRGWRDAVVAGLLLQAVYLGGVFWSVAHGLPAGISALIASAQPLLTAVLAGTILGERVSGRRWAGISLGTAGLALVVGPRLGTADPIPPSVFAVAVASTLAITAGTIWQKRRGGDGDLIATTAIQYAAACPAVGAGALLTETGRIDATAPFWFGLLWSVFGLSIGAVGLFLLMLRRGAVAAVASLLFLVPPVTALLGYLLFGETLAAIQLAGMALAAGGVALAARSEPQG